MGTVIMSEAIISPPSESISANVEAKRESRDDKSFSNPIMFNFSFDPIVVILNLTQYVNFANANEGIFSIIIHPNESNNIYMQYIRWQYFWNSANTLSILNSSVSGSIGTIIFDAIALQ